MTNKVLEAMIEDISSELNACMAVVKYENTELSEKWQDVIREIYSIICKAKKL